MERDKYNALEYDNEQEGETEGDGNEVVESNHKVDSGITSLYEESEISWSYDVNKKK
jgi:hypothetical protein